MTPPGHHYVRVREGRREFSDTVKKGQRFVLGAFLGAS